MGKLLLKAVLHNWDMICAYEGSWLTVTWKINTDGSYLIDEESFHIPDASDRIEDVGKKDHVLTKGRMPSDAFAELCSALEQDPWRDPAIESDGCDGVAWTIEQYVDGQVVRSSGELGYIYGQENLERIVSLLPKTVQPHGANAYVSVRRKD